MARSRNIKPSFFMNEDIVELSCEARLLFIGLWTLADREGRLENRPKKIKMSLFPADDINVSEQLSNISKYGFIELYNIDGIDIIQIVNFVKHQTPHGLEKDSELPDQDGLYTVYDRNPKNKTIVGKPHLLNKDQLAEFYNKSLISIDTNGVKTHQEQITDTESEQLKQDNNSYETVSISDQNALIPESFNLIPESINKNICPSNDEPVPEQANQNFKNEIQEIFEFWKTTFGKNDRTKLDNKRKSKILTRLREGYSVEEIKNGVMGCSKSDHHVQGQFTDIELICRDAVHLDRFIGYSQQIRFIPKTPEPERIDLSKYKVVEDRVW
ncbi:hypothetical protein [Acinetobacter baylyi]|uniref:Uncharacterized protein n=1 Tax=Acinetobacter baylyi (strain ATCC 33305 / BD413 / ADP1) TaxID=62977 RepID=Q6FAC8_ACIAD|nr:hypothetical protein [Acinetobacter baylyi]ENV53921.1 hypothetical protein F952_01974 [Acinetobacter baylyi DSM 14961 = CIP 107474]KAF2373114.1 hypothetical protein BSL88_00300 [Acinetobacter baylyi]KAF2374471.1 hypothetical protein BSL67_07620 [Acinetobacter baylyi]KAF2377158.1 hypothetical protein BSN81_09845 [Acinetobacter baylyi]KAF2380946.1 hypothetical protein BSN83_07385 [Acinetobacter baylyi]